MSRNAWLRLADMVEAAEAVQGWCADHTAQSLEADPMRMAAVEWQLLVFGEAAKCVPADVQARLPAFDWRQATRLRDFLAHGYAGVDPSDLIEIAEVHLPRDLPHLRRFRDELELELAVRS